MTSFHVRFLSSPETGKSPRIPTNHSCNTYTFSHLHCALDNVYTGHLIKTQTHCLSLQKPTFLLTSLFFTKLAQASPFSRKNPFFPFSLHLPSPVPQRCPSPWEDALAPSPFAGNPAAHFYTRQFSTRTPPARLHKTAAPPAYLGRAACARGPAAPAAASPPSSLAKRTAPPPPPPTARGPARPRRSPPPRRAPAAPGTSPAISLRRV